MLSRGGASGGLAGSLNEVWPVKRARSPSKTNSVDGMRVFIRALLAFGIKPAEIKVMLQDNPAKLMWLD